MPDVSPEKIGSYARIVDDKIEEKSCCQFRQEDLFNIVNDLDEINNLITIPASEVLAKIKMGEPVEYDHVVIEDDLDIRKLDLPKDEKGFFIIISPIRIRNSLIYGKVYFTTTIFKEPVDFMNSQFGSDAYFYESKLDGSIFQQSIFNGVA